MANRLEAKEIIEHLPVKNIGGEKQRAGSVLLLGDGPTQKIAKTLLRASRFITVVSVVQEGTVDWEQARELEEFSAYELVETDGNGSQEEILSRPEFRNRFDTIAGENVTKLIDKVLKV